MSKVTVGRVDKTNLDENAIRVRIDRNTPLGNSIAVQGDVTRKEAIAAYKGYFDHNMKRKSSKVYQKIQNIKEILDSGFDVELTCWCSPKDCHGDVIKEYLDKKMGLE